MIVAVVFEYDKKTRVLVGGSGRYGYVVGKSKDTWHSMHSEPYCCPLRFCFFRQPRHDPSNERSVRD